MAAGVDGVIAVPNSAKDVEKGVEKKFRKANGIKQDEQNRREEQ
jgi:hypothetical protein